MSAGSVLVQWLLDARFATLRFPGAVGGILLARKGKVDDVLRSVPRRGSDFQLPRFCSRLLAKDLPGYKMQSKLSSPLHQTMHALRPIDQKEKRQDMTINVPLQVPVIFLLFYFASTPFVPK